MTGTTLIERPSEGSTGRSRISSRSLWECLQPRVVPALRSSLPRRSPLPGYRAWFPVSGASIHATGVSDSRSTAPRRRTGWRERNSPATFGHFGGAGTFLWVDPVADLALVVLTDREFGPMGACRLALAIRRRARRCRLTVPLPSRAMDYGLCLPNFPDGASPEGIDAAADAAERLGFSTVWTTDHVLVPQSASGDYGQIYEAILTLAWVGARYPRIRLGTSVIVVPQRNAIVLAKELASLDSLSGGRVSAGVGIGWNEAEFANLGVADRFHVRGAYLDETIRLWRHLWSGSTEPFKGGSTRSTTSRSGRCRPGGACRSSSGGARSRAPPRGSAGRWLSLERDLVRARTPSGSRRPCAAEAAGRPMPSLSARVRVQFGRTDGEGYAMRGSA